MTVPADPRKLADTAREARRLVRLMDDPRTFDKEIRGEGPAIVDALVALADQDGWRQIAAERLGQINALSERVEQLQQERDEAQERFRRTAIDADRYLRSKQSERAARESAEQERDDVLRGNWKQVPTNEGGPGKEEVYWLRNKLRSAVVHLRDVEDFYRWRGGTPDSPNLTRADRARDLYEQISEDFINGNMGIPPLRQRLESAEAALRAAQARADELGKALERRRTRDFNADLTGLVDDLESGAVLVEDFPPDLIRRARAALAASPQAGEHQTQETA